MKDAPPVAVSRVGRDADGIRRCFGCEDLRAVVAVQVCRHGNDVTETRRFRCDRLNIRESSQQLPFGSAQGRLVKVPRVGHPEPS
jgi:hypothetical protein